MIVNDKKRAIREFDETAGHHQTIKSSKRRMTESNGEQCELE
jgi:hypothetical protein